MRPDAWEPWWVIARALVISDPARAVESAREARSRCREQSKAAEIDAFIRKYSGD